MIFDSEEEAREYAINQNAKVKKLVKLANGKWIVLAIGEKNGK